MISQQSQAITDAKIILFFILFEQVVEIQLQII